jgi:hypothetical protein
MAVKIVADKSHTVRGLKVESPNVTLKAPLLFETTGRW